MERTNGTTETVETVVIGGGQAGLAVGYYLARKGLPFVILDASERIGDAWRHRYDSLHVFTTARLTRLPGMPFPAPPASYPTKDQVADYLEAYADRFDLPVRSSARVERLSREDGRFVVATGEGRIAATNVVVAMSNYQLPRVPAFASELSQDIVQLHSSRYRNPTQFQDGDVLVVGASDSGSEIALEASRSRKTWLSGRTLPQIPFRIDTPFGRHVGVPLVVGQIFHRVLSIRTPVGRRVRSRIGSVGPNVRIKAADIDAAGITRIPRITGVENGRPRTEDGRVLDVANVVWCTGFRPDYTWIDLPIFGDAENPKEPVHDAGVIPDQPGLYFVGLFYLYALTSSLFRGVGRDAKRIAQAIAARQAGH